MSDKDKNISDASVQTAPAGQGNAALSHLDFSKVDLGAYSAHAWMHEDKKPWSASPQGRMAIRAFSRGVLGAAFFTTGGLLTRKWMHSDSGVRYDPAKGFMEQENPLQFIAKLVDTVAGKPIEITVKNVARLAGKEEAAAIKLGQRATRFRQTKYKGDWEKTGSSGRSLGSETVHVTFDFFCASIGDAFGRDIAGWIDPNVKHKWIKKGHIDVPEAAKTVLKSAWRYVTYNGGEDWAVAIPYVYFMKGQRSLINHFSPGFIYDSDRNLNGGSFKVAEDVHVSDQYNVVGNYNKEGIIDLQNRFVVYNMGTLMYRELYEYIGKKLHGQHAVLYGDPDPAHQVQKGLGGKAADLFKWVARSVIKGGIYMMPAVPFFWITRTPQTNYRGLLIEKNLGSMTIEKKQSRWRREHAEQIFERLPAIERTGEKIEELLHTPAAFKGMHLGEMTEASARTTPVAFSSHEYNSGVHPFNGKRDGFRKYPSTDNPADWLEGAHANPIARGFHHTKRTPFDTTDSALNSVAIASDRFRHGLDGPARWADQNLGHVGTRIKDAIGLKYRAEDGTLKYSDFTRFTHPFMNAAASYTPYMYAKAEFANLWDYGKMDVALERTIDGAAGLKWGEFKAGAGEVWRAFWHKPFKDAEREAVAQHRIEVDETPALGMIENRGDADVRSGRSNWRERIISTPKALEEIRPKSQSHAASIERKPVRSHAEQEAMRKALEEHDPPTNSVN